MFNSKYMLAMNPYQGDTPKVLFVCSGGILRSPTAAHTAAEFYGWNTRSAGIYFDAVPQVTDVLLEWADKIYCLEREHANYISEKHEKQYDDKIEVLGIPDKYEYRNPELVKLIRLKLDGVKLKGKVKEVHSQGYGW